MEVRYIYITQEIRCFCKRSYDLMGTSSTLAKGRNIIMITIYGQMWPKLKFTPFSTSPLIQMRVVHGYSIQYKVYHGRNTKGSGNIDTQFNIRSIVVENETYTLIDNITLYPHLNITTPTPSLIPQASEDGHWPRYKRSVFYRIRSRQVINKVLVIEIYLPSRLGVFDEIVIGSRVGQTS